MGSDNLKAALVAETALKCTRVPRTSLAATNPGPDALTIYWSYYCRVSRWYGRALLARDTLVLSLNRCLNGRRQKIGR
jgi:hypothetical protein